jgi:autoinducer 2-degrading protein
MYVVSVTIFVQNEFLDRFLEATLENASSSRRELGNVRFDVLQAEADPTQFLLYEAYLTKDDFTKHQETEHYLKWKITVANWMAQPRQGIRHVSRFFGDGLR